MLERSAFILPSYAATTFATQDGKVHFGIIVRRYVDEIEPFLVTGQRIRIPSWTDVEEFHSDQSLMLYGVQQQLTPQELADLIAQLATLWQPAPTNTFRDDVPQDIARIEKAVESEAFHLEDIRFS